MKVLVPLGTTVLVVAVGMVIYITGPSQKASGRSCLASNATEAVAWCIIVDGRAWTARRTNAWERFKGAITGNP